MSLVLQPIRSIRGGRLTTYTDRYRVACLLSWLPCNLGWLLRTFGSDKQRAEEHAYGPTYHALFRGFRYKRIKLMEIGVLDGASLLAWRAFFPRARIVGCDIEPKDRFAIGRIQTRVMDQSSAAELAKVGSEEGPFDIIIDDGSHLSSHQIISFYDLFERITPNGIYIIEDVQTSFWPGHFGGKNINSPAFQQTCVGEFLELAKYVNYSEFRSADQVDQRRLECAKRITRIAFEHNLIVIHRGDNNMPSNYERQARANNYWKDRQ
ncbi:MAG TPA: hypothetical protein PLD10_22045 [Rhodopila sp.]|nr:hypothetical protein [Rhodopila sp.]